MKKMNRRTFVKDLGIASAASALCMAGAVSAGADETGDFIAGKYQATVNGHNAPFTVTCTFTERALADIDVTGNLESRGVGAWALGKLSRSIIANQSLNVDTIAGATISSFALLLGVEDCAAQAGADAYLLDREAEHVVPEAEYTADVCVVGGGGAGCVAAIRAAQAGAKVVIMDKVDIIGGSTNVSGGALNAVDPYRQEKQGIEDSVEQFYESTFTGGGEKGDPELIHFLTDHAMESVEWLENLGCAFKLQVSSATGSLGERSHYTAKPAGVGYTDTFRDYFDLYPDKVTIVGGTKAVELITDANGAVIGVRGEHKSGSEVVVHAASVVLATGGFGANIEFRQSVNDGVWSEVTLDSGIGCTNINPCAQGDGLGLAEAVGAELIGLSDIQLHPCGTPGTGLMKDVRTSGRNRVFVNVDGDRFVNEGAKRDTLCKAIFEQPGATYWIVVNKVRYPNLTDFDKDGQRMGDMIALGNVIAADTIEKLAAATGMDAKKLQASIDTYNAVVAGELEDPLGFQATNSNDVQLVEGPWYACKKVPTVHHTMGGVRVNINSQAMTADGEPIAGLFAAGEVTGGIHGNNRLGGNAICDCMTFGRNAGLRAAQNAGFGLEK